MRRRRLLIAVSAAALVGSVATEAGLQAANSRKPSADTANSRYSSFKTKANASSSVPMPAPDFRKLRGTGSYSPSTEDPFAAFKSGVGQDSAAVSAAATSFRVQTKELPAPIIQGRVDSGQTRVDSAPTQVLQGRLDTIIKTAPQRAATASVPPEIFRGWLEQAHPSFAQNTSALARNQVLEVKGVYDNSNKTLRSLGIPFQQIRGADLETLPLSQTRVVVVNCPGRVPRQSFQSVRDFVASGGYLLSTDWASDNLVEQAFPGYIKWDRHSNKQSVYDAEIVNPDPSLFSRTVTNASWKMDIDSHMISPLRPDVRVLARSKQLLAEDPASGGILALVFPFGRGYVMHLVGHFDNNTVMAFRHMLADPAPQIGISLRQALAANFVVAGLQKTRIPVR